jgi:hypothetical protein
MLTSPPARPAETRRLVLVDFDWEDADLVPDLLRKPGISVRLVAGERDEDPGVQLADLCELPRTLDLADLTREIFDLALISGRSRRRTHVEGLLQAMGTPSQTPQDFVAEVEAVSGYTLDMETALRLHAALLDAALGGDGAIAAGPMIRDGAAETAIDPGAPEPEAATVMEFVPALGDAEGLEAAFSSLMTRTGATRVELHVGASDGIRPSLALGGENPLLGTLVRLAQSEEQPQIVSRVTEESEGETWGAWPFRTAEHRGVVAAAGMSPRRWRTWERAVHEMRAAWDERDRSKIGPAFPLVPAARSGWLTPAEFQQRLELAVERHRRDGLRFALHRIDLPMSATAADVFAERLPEQLRDTDCLCRPTAQRALMLTATSTERFRYLRGRLLFLWHEAWLAAGNERPIPGLVEERCEMTREADASGFLRQGRSWLAPSTP